MQKLAVIQHTYTEFLGQLEDQLEKRGIGFNYYRMAVGDVLPSSALQFDGLFLLGGGHPNVDETHCPWFPDEINLIGVYEKAGRPVVGMGFGGLSVAAAHGAELSAEPFHNAYWTTARLTEAGRGDAVAESVDGRRVLVLYNGSAVLPDDVEPLLVDDDGNWLLIRPAPLTYGLLFRPEMKPGMLEDLVMEDDRETPENLGELMIEARSNWADMQDVTDQLAVALVGKLDLMHERHKAPVFSLKVE
ncbi:MAG: type 1 glutamine amidotransferase [Pseudomonadota bacterium]